MKKIVNSLRKVLRTPSSKVRWKEILALLVLLLAVVFFRSERKELGNIVPHLKAADPFWLVVLSALTLLTFLCQAGIYRNSFAATGRVLSWPMALQLYLKRNFLGVFLPAGGVSALAYSPSQLRKSGFSTIRIHQSGALFAFASLVSVFVAGLPIVAIAMSSNSNLHEAWMALVLLAAMIGLILLAIRSLRTKGKLYQLIIRRFPSFAPTITELFDTNINYRRFFTAILFSVGVELCGMLTIWAAMQALGFPARVEVAATAYIISILMSVISPFLRGLGAVELALVYILGQYGYLGVAALSITVLYRVFEFWLPLASGFIAFVWKAKNIFLRAFPALLTFTLGIVNIISAITPPINTRMHWLHNYVPLSSIHATNLLVLFAGLALLVTAAFLIRGMRNAWTFAVALAVISIVGNLAKALDYEESILSVITLLTLLFTADQYRRRSSNKWMRTGIQSSAIVFGSVLFFGFISFYFIDKRHFNIDFTWRQSLMYTFRMFVLVDDPELHPVTRFGHEFTMLIRFLGFFTWGFFFFTLMRPFRQQHAPSESNRKKARLLLEQYGQSPIDYFKTYKDKLIFFSDLYDAFIAYRIAGGFAIVLEEPVCSEEHKVDVLREFDQECKKMGLKTAFYRVDENGIPWFNQLSKQKLMIGQEAIIEVDKFSLEGKERKSLRNGLNALQKKGYTIALHTAPHPLSFVKDLKKVSDEWLNVYDVEEVVFSQGMFDEEELRKQDIIAVQDENGAIKAFLNIIPDYAGEDCTYDLIRKTEDAPGAAMDALIVRLVEYAKEHRKQYVNLGLAPMTGITAPDNTAERIIRLASERIKRFQHYKGLREFKEKYANIWENKYLVYENDFDLLQLPSALNKVIKP